MRAATNTTTRLAAPMARWTTFSQSLTPKRRPAPQTLCSTRFSAEDAVEDAVENQAAEDAGVIEQLREELAAAQAQVDEYIDKLQRTAADFQNTQRRQQKQLADSIDRANADLIRRLLPVLDDFDLAFQNAPQPPAAQADEDAASAWIDGFRQIQKKLLDLLQEQGVSPDRRRWRV